MGLLAFQVVDGHIKNTSILSVLPMRALLNKFMVGAIVCNRKRVAVGMGSCLPPDPGQNRNFGAYANR